MSSTDENETLADIVAEYRNDADAMDRGELYQPTTEYLRRLLDRIEAIDSADAWRSLYSPGNAAALREALVAVKKSIDGIGESSLDCDPTILMAALTQICASLSARIECALSAPARNCDILSAEQCKETMGIYLSQEATDRDRDIARCTAYGVIDALFAQSTERKGEGGGSD